MTPRSFWKIVLKLAGLWLFIQALPTILQHVRQVVYYLQSNEAGIFYGVFFTFLSVSLSLGCFYLLLFRTEWLITKLQLDKGFAEELFAVRMHRSSILAITINIIGIMMLVESIPAICEQAYSIVTLRKSGVAHMMDDNTPDYTWMIFHIAKSLLAILLMIYCREVVNFIEAKRKNSSSKLFIEPVEDAAKPKEPTNEILKHYED
jgi:hypothetical protein